MNELVAQFEQMMEHGTEADARKFVADHFSEFPEEFQQKLAVEFFTEAVENARVQALRKDVAEEIEALERGE